MPTAAQFAVEMDEQAVIRGFQNIGAEGRKLEGGLQKVGARGNVVFTQLRERQERARDATQLLSRTIGAEIPRALEKVIARSEVASKVMASLFRVGVIAGFAVALSSFAVDVIGKLIEWWNRAEDAKNKALEIDQQRANKLLVESLENTRQLKLRAALAGADEIRAVEIKLNEDLKNLRERMDQVKAGDKPAIRQLLTERIALERAAAADVGVIRDKQAQASAAVRMEADIAAIKFWLDAEKEASDEIKARRKEALGFERQIQDENVAFAIEGLHGEERVNAELTAKIANLEEVKRKYEEFPNIVANATGQEVLLQQQAAADIAAIRRQQAEQMARDWQMAVHHMASEIERFMDSPIQYLKNLWKRFLAEMVASWILSTRAMSAVGVGGAQQGGGFSLGGLLGGLFGVGNGGGGGFSLPSGSAGGMQLPPGVSTTFPSSGGGFQFGQFTPGVAGLAALPGGGGVGTGGILATGATVSSTAKLSAGAQFAAMLPMLVGAGGMLGGRAIGFGGPGRGALAGGLMGAGAVGLSLAALMGPLAGMAGSMTAIGALMGPLGIGIVAAGALIGLFMGMKNRNKQKAQAMDILNQGRAEWKRIISDFESHRIDYGSAVAGVTQVWQQMVQAWSSPSLGKYGGIAIQNNAPEFRRTLQQIEDLQAKRQWTAQSPMFGAAGEFSTGGFVQGPGARGQGSGFGPLRIPIMPRGMPSFASGGAVPIIAHTGEFVMQRSAVQRIGRGKLEAMNAGGSRGGPMIVVQGPLVQAAPGMSTEQLAEATIRKLERLLRDQGVSLRA